MDTLLPMEVSIRQQELEKRQKIQRTQMNQRNANQQFGGGISASDSGSAFRDDYTKSVYAQIRTNDMKMKDNMVHATSSAPYNKGR